MSLRSSARFDLRVTFKFCLFKISSGPYLFSNTITVQQKAVCYMLVICFDLRHVVE